MAMKTWEEEIAHSYVKGKNASGIPNDPFRRTLLGSALSNAENAAKGDSSNWGSSPSSRGTLLKPNSLFGSSSQYHDEDNPDIPLPWVSPVERGISEALEQTRVDAKNRVTMLIARQNYERLLHNVELGINDKFKKIARFPELFQAQLDRTKDPAMKWAHGHQRDIMTLYLSAPAGKDPAQYVYYIPYYRILEYELGRRAHAWLVKNALNENAQKALTGILRRLGKFSDKRVYYDMTAEPPYDWHSVSHQYTPVKHPSGREKLKFAPYLALGDYSLMALAKGYTEPLPNGEHNLCVTNLMAAVNDSVDYNGFQWVGPWNHTDLIGPGDDLNLLDLGKLIIMGTQFFNQDFTNFENYSGYGKAFRTVSLPHEIPILDGNGTLIKGDLCWKVK